jgi:hypothetical protein
MNMPPPAAPPANVSSFAPPGTAIRPLRPIGQRAGADANNFNNNNQSSMTPEEQVLMIEAQRVKLMSEGNPMHKIFPTTEMTHEVTGQPANPSGF